MDAETLARALEFVARGGDKHEAVKAIKPVEKPTKTVETPKVESHGLTPLAIAAALCRRFEGVYLRPYLCPAGVATIGVGATFYEDGTRVTLLDAPITKERAHDLLLYMVKTIYLPSVIKLCPTIDTPERAAAIIDFTYNLGAGKLKTSTLRRRINEGKWGDAKTELMKWTIGGGRVLKGLVKRRQAEIDLI